MISEDLQRIPAVRSAAALAGSDVEASQDRGEVTLVIPSEKLLEICRHLKEKEGFDRLCTVTAVDWHPLEPRFEVVYHLHAVRARQRLRLKCRVGGETPSIDSVYSVWKSADWYEREVFDLFGITFRNHPNLKRILMPDDWQGHPLRKDYPVHGYKYSYRDE
jgi:NADH-quinone oxidoreductase subunit C